MRLRASDEIRHRQVDGGVVILDLRTESYFSLDPVGSSMWTLLLKHGDRQGALGALRRKYAVDGARLEADLDAFIRRCAESGFLRTDDTPPGEAPTPPVRVGKRRFLTIRAWSSLLRTSRMLARRGFAETYRRIAATPKPEDSTDGEERLRKALGAFAMAENFFHMKRAPEDCVPRSLALFRFLRSVGLPVEHCIGVRRFPFQAHAWVEYRGRVIHDNPIQSKVFTAVARVA